MKKKWAIFLIAILIVLQPILPLGSVSEPGLLGNWETVLADGMYFKLDKTIAQPYDTITINYNFKISEMDRHYWLISKSVLDTKSAGFGYKDLDPDKDDGYIVGSHTFKVYDDYGPFVVAVYGPQDDDTDIQDIGDAVAPYIINPVYGLAHSIYDLFTDDPVPTVMLFASKSYYVKPYSTVITSSNSVKPGDQINVTWKDQSANGSAWIGFFKAGEQDGWPLQKMKFSELSGNTWTVEAPRELGPYEFRTFLDERTVRTGTQAINISWGDNSGFTNVPVSVNPLESISVNYIGAPTDINAWIGIFEESFAGVVSDNWRYLYGVTEGIFQTTSPNKAGRYQFRMFDSKKNLVATSSAFEVLQRAATPPTPATPSTPSAPASPVTPTTPNTSTVPSVLSATAGERSVELKWNTIGDAEGLDGFYIYRSISSDGSNASLLNDFPISASSYTDNSAEGGKTYYYYIKAVFSTSTTAKTYGEASNIVSASLTQGKRTIALVIGNPMMKVNNVDKEIDPGKGTAPVLVNGKTFVPIRAIVETMGGSVSWEGTEKKLTIVLKDKTIELWVNSKATKVNGVNKEAEVAPFISETERTMIPLRYAIENLACDMTWDGPSKSITISYDMPASGGQLAVVPTAPSQGSTGENTTPPADTAPANQQNWTGTWNTSYGDIVFDPPVGDQVIGHYYSNVGTLTGTMSVSDTGKAVLQGSYRDSSAADSGKGFFEFMLSDDKQSFTGFWRSEDDDPLSRTEWNGERMIE